MKFLVYPKSIEHIYELKEKPVGFIIGLKDYSIFQELKLSVDELKNINIDNDIYVSINRPIHNSMLSDLESNLKELSKLNIKGIMYEDISIYMINKELNLNLNLIWNTMHLPTNSYSVNYWYNKGVKGTVLSTELMIDDFNKIKEETNSLIYVYLYGHVPIFESSRSLITNYMLHKNIDKNSNNYLIYEKDRDKYYNIYEEYGNTFILEDVLNGINTLDDLNVDYVILNSLLIDKDEFDNELDDFINRKKKDNVFTGFLYKESIFKVKE